jgi:hypothetical protein
VLLIQVSTMLLKSRTLRGSRARALRSLLFSTEFAACSDSAHLLLHVRSMRCTCAGATASVAALTVTGASLAAPLLAARVRFVLPRSPAELLHA